MHPPEVNELARLCQAVGSDVLQVQGGGGNASVKSADGRTMWIKASGLCMGAVREEDGIVQTDLERVLASIRFPEARNLERAAAQEEYTRRLAAAAVCRPPYRPSLESGFHAALDRVVLHTHPVFSNAFTCMEDGREALTAALGRAVCWIPYRPPGFALSSLVDERVNLETRRNGRRPSLVLLENHGLIASGTDLQEVLGFSAEVTRAGERFFGALPEGACTEDEPAPELVHWASVLERELAARSPGTPFAVQATRRPALHLAASEATRWLGAGPLVPDDVVYGVGEVFEVPELADPGVWLASRATPFPVPMVLAVGGTRCVLVARNLGLVRAQEQALLAHVLVRQLIDRRGKAHELRAGEKEYLQGMESEQFRRMVSDRSEGDGACRS